MIQLFVYGTLMERASHGGLLAQACDRIAATTRGSLYHLPAGYPALCLVDRGFVHGELVTLPDAKIFVLLDQYEGVAEGLYTRQRVPVQAGLKNYRAWTYVMEDPQKDHNGRFLTSGRWNQRLRR